MPVFFVLFFCESLSKKRQAVPRFKKMLYFGYPVFKRRRTEKNYYGQIKNTVCRKLLAQHYFEISRSCEERAHLRDRYLNTHTFVTIFKYLEHRKRSSPFNVHRNLVDRSYLTTGVINLQDKKNR